jgi:23S rRNA (guanine2445-N2)-methyltransferase / 23S rRNA (guanine2069-N7)-methyltransferase
LFAGSLETAYRACLWSRFSTRILLPLAEFKAPDTDALYKGAFEVGCPKHLAKDGTFAVDCTAVSSPIEHTRFAALRVKDAVVDQFKQRYKRRPSIDVNRPDIRIRLFLNKDKAALSLDLSGESLHRRGYRAAGGEAPLKESLAAAILCFAGWSDSVAPESLLLDPMCGSGTLLIEAGLMCGDIAPGLGRKYFGFLKWCGHDKALWERLVAEAVERENQAVEHPWPGIVGYDSDRAAVGGALKNIESAGLRGLVHVERRDLAGLKNPLGRKKQGRSRTGILALNPPYGARLSGANEVKYLYRCIGRKLREEFAGWRAGVLIGRPDFADAFGMEPVKQYRLYNGPLLCNLWIFDVPCQSADKAFPGWQAGSGTDAKEARDFANRLRKNLKQILKWASQEEVACFRIYDSDIPEYNLAVDLYETLVHVQEYAPPKTVDPEKASGRVKQAVQVIQDVLGIKRNRIFLKRRQKQKGRAQYQKQADRSRLYEVREGRCRFLVNLTDYLDTGLFLDLRILRSMIQAKAEGRRFLNLFGYTGAATVHAAMGGAKTTTMVDLSPVYIDWARSNLALNGFGSKNHKMVRADCMAWLSKARNQYDLIFADPPTFSNTRSLKRVFDVQQEHAELIRLAMRRLAPEGLLIFSTNFKRFKIDLEALSGYDIRDISRMTIPRDFKRHPRIHQCWEVRRKA